MPYNPGIRYDFSPIYQGAVEGGRAVAQGIESMGRGAESAGKSIAGAITAQKQTKDELDFLSGTAASLKDQNAITDEEYQKFLSGSLGAKRGIVSMGSTKLHQIYKEQSAKSDFQFDPSKMIDLGATDPRLKGKIAVQTNRGQVQIIDTNTGNPMVDPNQRFQQVTLPDGTIATIDAARPKGAAHFASPAKAGSGLDVNQIQADNIQKQIDTLKSDLQKGNEYSGWDWWGKTFGGVKKSDKIKELEMTRDAFLKGKRTSVVSPGIPPPAAPAADSSAVEDPSAAQNPIVKTKQDFDALPPGAMYIGADGRRYRKP